MLDVTVDKIEGSVPVTVIRLAGELDASNYEALIAQTQALYTEGMRDLLVDLTHLSFVSSAGLIGLHSMALVMRGESLADSGGGWGAFHAISYDVDSAASQEEHYKLLKPQAVVRKVLDTSGFSRIMPIFADEATAVASYG